MSLRTLAKKALPWIALVLALVVLGYTWNGALAKATEGTKDRGEAIAAYRAVLRFDVPDVSDVRYRLAVLH